ncbi:MAG: transglutaminase domain-containing protein [Candidatus Nealsonbacteria bacterium]|nr:transglutaminase domain-containing protein [Candidatus Nealsonbacteria bacterium]
MQWTQTRRFRNSIIPGLLAALLAAGCSENDAATPTNSSVVGETWDVNYLGGARVGYTHTTVTEVAESTRKLVETEAVDYFSVKRFGDRATLGIRTVSTETRDAKLIEYRCETSLGSAPTKSTGRVAGDRLELKTTSKGKTTNRSIAWSDDIGGPFADQRSLRDKPMQPGEKRSFRMIAAVFNQVAAVEMTAADNEQVQLPDGAKQLLRIEMVASFSAGQSLSSVYWCDPKGEIIRVHSEGGTARVRGTKELAMAKTDAVDLDLGYDMTVKVARALPNPHATRRVRYRVQLKENDPAKVFASGPSQQVKSIDRRTAEITVYALRPGRPGDPDATRDPPTDGDRKPSNMIQSDFPKIVAIARQAAGDETDAWQVARKLEHYVREYIEEKGFTQALATAAEVAEKPVGDCSEHAMLLAAVARARGIPARVAMGLVYMFNARAFCYHMWTEVYVDDRWIPLDGTLALGGIGAAHLKLAHSNFKNEASLLSLLPLIKAIGQLKIEIIEIE